MSNKVVILTAGAGSRLNQRTRFFNKAILRVGNKAAISHIVELFPPETQFVIALGHLGDIVRQYVQIAHPDLHFTFVEIDKYSVPGSGPGYALKRCEPHLQQPFYFVACDTLITQDSFWKQNHQQDNYIAYDEIPSDFVEDYCTLILNGDMVHKFIDKSPEGTVHAFTGLAHIQDWKLFWAEMNANDKMIKQEIQLSPALANLPNLRGVHMKWFDVGCERGLLHARQHHKGIDNLDKLDEEIYLVNNNIIKYFHNSKIIKNRMERARRLDGLVPKILEATDNFYKYRHVSGDDLFHRSDILELMPKLLDYAKERLWIDGSREDHSPQLFKLTCEDFYRKKTISRIEDFYKKTHIPNQQETINGHFSEKSDYYLYLIDWDYLCTKAIPSQFHGDFQPGNIIADMEKKFTFIDWRQDFGGFLPCGDRYYDFAKMYASLLMPHSSIKNNNFSLRKSGGEIFVDIFVPGYIRDCRDIFESWLKKNKYDISHVFLLSAIVMWNMAPLHEHPLDEWLYYYAKHMLSQIYVSK